MAKPTTKRYQKYRHEKVLELLGHKHVEENPEWAQHGREHEPRAIAGYEFKYDVDVEHNVFLISEKFDWLAGSPDLLHLPNYDAGGEVKCRALFKNYKKYREIAEQHKGTTRACPAENRHQVQGHMMLTGFSYWWFINYYIGDNLEGGLVQKIHRVAVPRDNKLIEQMEHRCQEFMLECYELAGLA
ncbi:MAG: hypothetical protein AMJ84_00285 [Acidithiobacillales bacterium SM23_46]|nr:MAG: hypothetical protein AMJ84_00285 [Acidithiobacillales bacterium SM23_46]KPL29006.1 MAG: hypothetical protein AMJ72_00165 [Acidithiobacillales bacterium SM1_46]